MPRWIRHALRTLLHLAADAAAVLASFYLAYRFRFDPDRLASLVPVVGSDPGWEHWLKLLRAVVPIWLLLFASVSRLYSRSYSGPFDRFLRILQACFLGVVVSLVAAFLYSRLGYSRLAIIAAGPIAVVLVSLAHGAVLWIDRWAASLETVSPMLLVGGGMVSDLVRENIRSRHPRVPIHEIDEIPPADSLLETIQRLGIDELVLVRSDLDHKALLELAELCESEGIQFRMIPDLLELRLGEVQMDESLGLPAYRLQHTQMTRANFAAKRAFDALSAALVLSVLGLPLLLVALLIKLDSRGPALFKQKRIGFRGEPFEAYKFRTMVSDAEKKVEEVKSLTNDQEGGFFKAKNDPRVTRIGRWLRRFSFDEFPQFLNVLRGEMSVVGPRPLAVATGEMEDLIKRFGRTAKKRVNTLPGITGLWQVSGRSDISAEERFKLDMFYIEHWSLGLDLEIILKTAPAMISGKGAY